MSVKNSNTVAVERRADLASLFCMIGRHGPAVALAVVAMISVLAAFIIYRTVRGKRRKATATAADSDSKSPGEEREASVIHPGPEPSQEESFSSEDSTDVSDESSSDVKEDTCITQSHPKIRLRRAAANEKKPPPSPKSDVQAPHNNRTTADDTEVFKADYQEEETADKDVSDEQNRRQEDKLQFALNSPVYFDQLPHMSEKINDRLEDNESTTEANSVKSNLEEPLVPIEDIPASLSCYGKDKMFKEENHHPDSNDYSIYSSNKQLCLEEEANEVEDKVMAPVQHSDGDDDDDDGGGLASEVSEEVSDKDHMNGFIQVDIHSLSLHKQQDGLACDQEDCVLPTVVDQVTECDPSLAPSSSLPFISEPIKVDDHSLTSDISDTVDFKNGQHFQSEVKQISPPLPKDTGLQSDLLFPRPETQCEKNETSTVVSAKESTDPQPQQISQCDSVSVDNFDEASATSAPDTYACDDENIVAPLTAEVSCPHLFSDKEINNEVSDKTTAAAAHAITEGSCQDQQSDHMENDGIKELSNTMVDSANDAAAWDDASITAPMCEERSQPDMLPVFQDHQSDQIQNNDDFSVVCVSPKDINPPIGNLKLLSFEQSELRDSDTDTSPVVRIESGISSMTVSPDLQDACNEFGMAVETLVLPVMDCDPQTEKRTEAQRGLVADDVAVSNINEDTSGMAFESYQSGLSQKPVSESTGWATYKSFAANEDTFGHEIEASYHSGVDQLVKQIDASITSFTTELKTKTDIKGVVEGVDVKQCSGVSVQKKVEIDAEKEKETEKTEISIMEATMDNNEWITDSNYQVLPWMNLSVPSFAQDKAETSSSTVEHQHSSPLADVACKDTDIVISTEVKPSNNLSLFDEITENSKKVVAVQPMPQNVNVTFRIHYHTHSPYQTVAVTGNQQELGNWKGFIPLERAKDGHWATVISLPAESHVEWKFVVVDKGEVCRWEECGNRLLDTGVGDDLVVHKWWGLL